MSDSLEPQNPYSSSGQASDLRTDHSGGYSPGSFDIGEAFSLAIEVFKKHWLLGSLASLVLFVVTMVATYGLGFLFLGVSLKYPIAGQVLSTLVNYFIQIPLGFGFVWLGIRAVQTHAKEENLPLECIFQGFKSFVNLVLINLLITLITLAVTLPGMLVSGGLAFAALGAAFFETLNPDALMKSDIFWILIPVGILGMFLPALFVTVRLGLATGLAVERNRSPITALKDSWALTQDTWLNLILYYIAWFFLFLIASPLIGAFVVLTCVTGAFAMMFLWSLAFGTAYKQLTAHLPPLTEEELSRIT